MALNAKEKKAREVAFEMYEKLLSAGRFTFAPMLTGSDQPVVPAATGADTESNLSGLGFADLAVQAVGYERGVEDPKVHVYVTRGSAAKLKRLEQTYNGVTIQVNNVGDPTVRPRIALSVTRHGKVYDRNGRVACGSSCAPAGAGYAGTFGAIVRKAGQPKLYMLSNNHVIGGCNHTVVGMPIMAPSTADSRPDIPAPISIGRHSEIVELRSGDPGLVHPCRADVALAEVVDDDHVSSWQGDSSHGFDTPTHIAAPATNMEVKKYGRTTGLTTGQIGAEIPTFMAVPYSAEKFTGTVWFQDIWTIFSPNNDFALPGDSGSLVVSADGRSAIGMIFAVDRVGRSAFILPMDYVQSLFGGIELVGNHGV